MIYYEDMIPGEKLQSPTTTVDRDEMVAFARTWDPIPVHVDEAAAQAMFGGLTAPGLYVLALKMRLIYQLPPLAVIASAGYDELRFHQPVRPADVLTLNMEFLKRRESNSKPDRGVVHARFALINQQDVTVMSHLDTLIVGRRPRVTTL